MDTTLPAAIPWAFLGVGYLGFVFYLLTSLGNPADESLSSLGDIVVHKGKTILTAALAVPVLVYAAQYYNELNILSAFAGGYLNVSLIRKVTETWASRAKVTGGG